MPRWGEIPLAWLELTHTWLPSQLLALLEQVNQRDIDHKDLAAVRKVWEEMNHDG